MQKIKSLFLILVAVQLVAAACLVETINASEYKLGVDDVLSITVLGQGDYKLTEEKTISPTGRILLSIMQEEVEISGLTIKMASEKLRTRLAADYLNKPMVIIEVVEFNSQKILVIGEVKKPGEVTLQSSEMALKELIVQSGGPTGDMDQTVLIVRAEPDDEDATTVFTMDELLLSNKHESITVSAGDIVYILGRDKQLPLQDMEKTVYVFGQVTKPGILPFTRNMTVMRAIISAGNFTKEAAPGRTTVKRKDGKKIKTISVNLDKMMSGGDKSRDIELKAGDIVYVPRAIF